MGSTFSFSDLCNEKFKQTCAVHAVRDIHALLDASTLKLSDSFKSNNFTQLHTSEILFTWSQNTNNGRVWVNTDIGYNWLTYYISKTDESNMRRFICTKAGYDWLLYLYNNYGSNTNAASTIYTFEQQLTKYHCCEWLDTDYGKSWLNSPLSHRWLSSDDGIQWLLNNAHDETYEMAYVQKLLASDNFYKWVIVNAGDYYKDNLRWFNTKSWKKWVQELDLPRFLSLDGCKIDYSKIGGNEIVSGKIVDNKIDDCEIVCSKINNDCKIDCGYQLDYKYLAADRPIYIAIVKKWFDMDGYKLANTKYDETWFYNNIYRLLIRLSPYSPQNVYDKKSGPKYEISIECINSIFDNVPGAYEWLNTDDGHVWLEEQANGIYVEKWKNNIDYIKWEVTSVDWSVCRNYSTALASSCNNDELTRLIYAWINSDDGQVWITSQSTMYKSWLDTKYGTDWLKTDGGKAWLSLPCSEQWRRIKFISTDECIAWSNTAKGCDWLSSDVGDKWIHHTNMVTISKYIAWLNSKSGQAWSASSTKFHQWMTTNDGWTWLTTSGKSWFETPSGQKFFNSDMCDNYVRVEKQFKPLLSGFFAKYYKTPCGNAYLSKNGKSFVRWFIAWASSHAVEFTKWLITDDGKAFTDNGIEQHIKKHNRTQNKMIKK